MSNRLEPEIIQVIEEIVARRLREVLEERAKLVTIDHFAEAMERIDKRFEESQKRFEESQKEMRRGFEESDKKSDRMLDILNNLQTQLGKPFEQFARNVIIRILEGEGLTKVLLKPIKIKDKNRFVFPDGTNEIEIDGFSEEPAIIIEITSILRNMDKVNTFLRKKEFIEKKFKKKFRGFFIAAGSELTQREIADITVLLRKHQSELINL